MFGSGKKKAVGSGGITTITVTDIDQTKITSENLAKVRKHFNEGVEDKIDDNILARYLSARDNDVEATIEQISRVRFVRSF